MHRHCPTSCQVVEAMLSLNNTLVVTDALTVIVVVNTSISSTTAVLEATTAIGNVVADWMPEEIVGGEPKCFVDEQTQAIYVQVYVLSASHQFVHGSLHGLPTNN